MSWLGGRDSNYQHFTPNSARSYASCDASQRPVTLQRLTLPAGVVLQLIPGIGTRSPNRACAVRPSGVRR